MELKTKTGKLDEQTPISVKLNDKEYLLIPTGALKQKLVKKNVITEEEDKARKVAEAAITAISKDDIKIGEYEILSEAAIDLPAIRKKVIDALGAKNTIRAVLLLNQNGFTGKANGNLKVIGAWTGKDGKDTVGEFNLYDILKPIVRSGATDMKADEVTVGRIVRAFGDVSRNHFRTLVGKGPFAGLDPKNTFAWYYGGIYDCGSIHQQLGHFMGMAFAMKNKRLPKNMSLDFPASYTARAPPVQATLHKFVIVATYIMEGTSDVDAFQEAFKSFATTTGADEKVMTELKEPTIITYVMSLGEKFTQMLSVELRKKFKKDLLSDAFAKSSFHSDSVKKAMKAAKKAKGDNEETVVKKE